MNTELRFPYVSFVDACCVCRLLVLFRYSIRCLKSETGQPRYLVLLMFTISTMLVMLSNCHLILLLPSGLFATIVIVGAVIVILRWVAAFPKR
ncbi:MAG: hypothetical protein FJ267_01535 [Planctomycetes bacterium]|nr:hypothetical protein [Planctomycetota bacterium]